MNDALAPSAVSADATSSACEALLMKPSRIGDAVIVTDASGCVTFMNAVAEELTGRSAAAALGRALAEVLPLVKGADGDAPADSLASACAAVNGAALTLVSLLARADGTRMPIDASAAAIRRADATLSGMVVTFREKGARTQADRNTRADQPQDFFAILAHELRNPLATIGNALQIMQVVQDDGATTAAARAIIERQLKHLTRLIDDLLDMSRMTQGKFVLCKERSALRDIVQLALAIARPQLEGKEHKLQIELPPDVYLSADANHLGQAFANLLHNASKYSSAGTPIRLTAVATEDQIIIQVIDQGVGIPADMFERVFDKYEQVARSEDRTHDGLGIGLTLVKHIVELHGGSVAAASAGRGRGSEFTVRLPRDQAQAGQDMAQHAAIPTESSRRLRILVADDNRDAAHTLALLLSLEGHEVREAHDGLEALTTGDDFAPQLVLLDLGMPLLDGFETARQMQQRPWGKLAHLVALTGWGQEADRRKALAAGFRDHLVKPAEPDALRAVMDRIVTE